MEDENQHFVGKVAQKALLARGGKVLVARGTGDELWDIPGGRINSGEKPAAALAREIKEELGVDITVGAPFFVDLIRATKSGEERYFICFHAEIAEGQEPTTDNKEESAELLWLGKDDIDAAPMYEVCRDALKAYFAE